ncbi:Lcl C-terminal domain-containing protein [Kaarinaea lacus]
MTNSTAQIFLTIATLMVTGLCSAQQCRDSLPDSAPDQRFEPLADGLVVDQHSHLMWMRCSIGQLWDRTKETCIGEPQSLTWIQANQLVSEQTYHGFHWRLPSVEELSAIAELRCHNPAIDLQLFPATPASHYWSATPFANKYSHYWLVQFLSGENHTDSEKRFAFVRLVKTLGQ